MEQSQPFQLIDNQLKFRTLESGQVDGIKLTDDEREYLLPHFLMLLVGKPGSGKTTLLKQLLTNQQMYYRKFDDVFLISPSHAKMGIKLKKDNVASQFSLDWLFDKFNDLNEQQINNVFGNRLRMTQKDKKLHASGKVLAQPKILNDNKSRFLLGDMFKSTPAAVRVEEQKRGGKTQKVQVQNEDHQIAMQKMYEDLKQLPREQQEKTHKNILVVLDDVVGSIKKAEFDPRLAQLVMNRRHIVFNGTISIIMVTQKYTLIPSRVRSNANWIVFYQINPMDIELVFRDAVVLSREQWFNLIQFVFGKQASSEIMSREFQTKAQEIIDKRRTQQQQQQIDQEEEKRPETVKHVKVADEIRDKKYDNLGIWVETNMYFKNFKRVKF